MSNSRYYYKSKQQESTVKYTSVYTGNLDLHQAIALKSACWKLPVDTDILNKKKIILNDNSLALDLLDIHGKVQYTQHIKTLLDEGFEIYAWTDHLSRIRGIDHDYFKNPTFTPLPENELLQLLKTSLNKDECYILGPDKMCEDIWESQGCYHVIHLDKICALNTNIIEKLFDYMRHLKGIRIALGKDKIDETISLLKNTQLIADHIIHIKDDHLTYMDDLLTMVKHLHIDIENDETKIQFLFVSSVLESIELVKIADLNPSIEVDLVFNAPNLKKMHLKNKDPESSWILFPKLKIFNSHLLEYVHLDFEILSETVKEILAKNSLLKEIKFYLSGIDEWDNEFESLPSLKFLKRATLKYGACIEGFVGILLGIAPNLECLRIEGLRNKNLIPKVIAMPKHVNLTKLVISGLTANTRFIWKLLQNTPHVENLTISNTYDNLIPITHDDIPPLDKLETFEYNAYDREFTRINLPVLLTRWKNIKNLNISYYRKNIDFDFSSLAIPQITNLFVHCHPSSEAFFLSNIVCAFPYLRSLRISNFEMQNVDNLPLLPYLQTLTIHGEYDCFYEDDQSITKNNYIRIIKSCPNLKCVNIKNINLAAFTNLSFQTNSVESLNIYHNVIDNDDDFLDPMKHSLKSLINTFPKLKSLSVNSNTTQEPTFIDLVSLKNLKSLQLSCRITEEDARHLNNLLPHFKDSIDTAYYLSELLVQQDYENYQRSMSSLRPAKLAANSNQYDFDDDTEYKSNQYKLQKIFHDKVIDGHVHTIAPNSYREHAFNQIEIIDDKVAIKNQECYTVIDVPELSVDIQEFYKINADVPDIWLGEIHFDANIMGSKRLVLTGISSHDKLLGITVKGAASFKLEYDKENRMYAISLEGQIEHKLIILYVLQTNFNILNELNLNLSLHHLVDSLRNFSIGKLEGNPKTDLEKIQAMWQQGLGACRHRTTLFKLAADKLNIKSVIINNGIHSFIEVEEDGRWSTIDLGGMPVLSGSIKIDPIPIAYVVPALPAPKELVIDKNNPFQTWENIPTTGLTWQSYCNDVLTFGDKVSDANRNILLLAHDNDHQMIFYHFETLLKMKRRKCFVINHLDDINNIEVIIDNDKGVHKNIDSELIEFIKTATFGDVILVDWSDYQSRHVGFHCMLDSTVRRLYDVHIPQGVIIIAIQSKDIHIEDDFNSRFAGVSQIPCLASEKTYQPSSIDTVDTSTIVVHFRDEDWQKVMQGAFTILPNGNFHFMEGEFTKYIKQGYKNIVLQNAPLQNQDFQAYIRLLNNASHDRINGERIVIPNELRLFSLDKPEPLDVGDYIVYPKGSMPSDDIPYYVVNRYNLHELYSLHQVTIEGRLFLMPGIVSRHELSQHELMTIVITDTLSHAEWAKLLYEANQYQISLDIYPATTVEIPQAMYSHATTEMPSSLNEQTRANIIITNDIGYLMHGYQSCFIIHVHEAMTYADLVESLSIVRSQNAIHFNQTTSQFVDYLHNRQYVTLVGTLSHMLAKKIETLFLPSPYLFINGELVNFPDLELELITKSMPPLPLCNQIEFNVDANDYWKKLDSSNPQLKQLLKSVCTKYYEITNEKPFEFSALVSMMKALHNPATRHNNPLKPFIRLRANNQTLMQAAKDVWTHYDGYKQKNGQGNRMSKVLNTLRYMPYVFIAGSSGVGKSTFIQNYMRNQHFIVHEGMKDLALRIKQARMSGKYTIIFIDEANLYADKSFDILEAVIAGRPLLLDGELIPLPENVRFIFAGNFSNYQNRQQHELFNRHGGVITFKEYPDSYLKSTIIQPVLNQISVDDQENWLANFFIHVYHKVNGWYPDKHPLTSRNLQMMVLRYQSFIVFDQLPANEAAYMAAYDEVSAFLDKNQRRQFSFDVKAILQIERSKRIKNAMKAKVNKTLSINHTFFTVTKSRRNPVRLLAQAFNIRKIRHSYSITNGIAGIILEGMPGEGKSLIAEAFLQSNGYILSNNEKDCISQQVYFKLSAGSLQEMTQFLQMVFHAGAVVIIDELNTLGLETVLNSLLSGKDMLGNPPQQVGFFVIATQNPPTFSKREVISDALANRFQKIVIPDYMPDELVAITQNKALVDAYLAARVYAKQKNLKPGPTPRHLFNKNFQHTALSLVNDVPDENAAGSEHTVSKSKRERQGEEITQLTLNTEMNSNQSPMKQLKFNEESRPSL